MINSYLMWIGSEHYAGIAEYSSEAVVQGISKRVPNAAVARAMTAPGVMVFVAHDEGEKRDCPTCAGSLECPNCRKLRLAIENEQERADAITSKLGELPPSGAQARTLRLAAEKIREWGEEMARCEGCDGIGHIDGGTGGTATLKDGSVWDYRRYTYWRNCSKLDKFDYQKDVLSLDMCPDCGGFGVIPEGKVFGLFVPERIEYIVKDDDEEKKLAEISKHATLIRSDELKSEAPRKCGRRHPGGVYVVAGTGKASKAAKRAVNDLIDAGIDVSTAEIHGSFVKFVRPIPIDEKRFRGIKRWQPGDDVTEEAGDIAEAMA